MSANEIPQIANQFGLDTSTRGNMMGTIYATQSALNIVKTVTTKNQHRIFQCSTSNSISHLNTIIEIV